MRFGVCIVLLFLIVYSCKSQAKKLELDKVVGGPCEGCEAIFEYGNRGLTWKDTLPGFLDNNPKLKLTGTVFLEDGKSPAENVILYIYQTNRDGIYPKKVNGKGWANRHGYIRGWVKTNKTGKYCFYTFRPASYPNRLEPEHIHVTVKEPGKNEYYIDEFTFDDDPLLTISKRKQLLNRGGSGVSKTINIDNIITINRDIILGQNIPNYK